MSDVSFSEVRSHTVVKRRNRQGGTSGRVTRFGSAQVQGDIVPTGAPVIGDGRYCAFQLELADVKRGTFGKSGIALAKLADAMYADYGLEPLLGTEVRAFEQVIATDFYGAPLASDDPARLDVADPFSVQCETVYGSETATQRFPTRYRLSVPRLRASEAQYAHQLITSADRPDAMWVGHTLVKRQPRATRKARTIRAKRTVGEVESLPVETLEQVVGQITPGTRRVFEHRGQRVTISVSDSKRINVRIGTGADAVKLPSNRTALGAARRILARVNA